MDFLGPKGALILDRWNSDSAMNFHEYIMEDPLSIGIPIAVLISIFLKRQDQMVLSLEKSWWDHRPRQNVVEQYFETSNSSVLCNIL